MPKTKLINSTDLMDFLILKGESAERTAALADVHLPSVQNRARYLRAHGYLKGDERTITAVGRLHHLNLKDKINETRTKLNNALDEVAIDPSIEWALTTLKRVLAYLLIRGLPLSVSKKIVTLIHDWATAGGENE